jgi:hypothetical protein
MKSLLQIDNLDDRREVYRLLQFLPPKWRWAWLAWVCGLPAKLAAELTFDALDVRMTREAEWGCQKANKYVTNHAYRLAFMTASQHALDWEVIERALLLLARRKITPRELPEVCKLRSV